MTLIEMITVDSQRLIRRMKLVKLLNNTIHQKIIKPLKKHIARQQNRILGQETLFTIIKKLFTDIAEQQVFIRKLERRLVDQICRGGGNELKKHLIMQ